MGRGYSVAHGIMCRIEWHGTPRSVAFCYPYVIGFDPNFIEIRHAETVSTVMCYCKRMMLISMGEERIDSGT